MILQLLVCSGSIATNTNIDESLHIKKPQKKPQKKPLKL